MYRGDFPGHNAIHFLRKRLLHISGPQTGLDVADWHTRVKSRERATECGGCIPLNERDVRTGFRVYRFEGGQNSGGRGGKRLA